MLTRAAASEAGGSPANATFDLPKIFAGLEHASAILLAVSGGPDSMALLLLAVEWAAGLGTTAPTLHVATVDHGLRLEAAAEAILVGNTARDLGLSHATLLWSGPKPTTRIQERARAARYALLTEHARGIGAAYLLTAHHADDQAETVLLRLTRGSGLTGLAGMRREAALDPGLTLVRPLLDCPKTALLALCREEGQSWADDPSNLDPAYARARLRSQTQQLKRLGLDRAALLRLSRRLARADAALETETDRLERRIDPKRAPGAWRADLAPARDIEPELLVRLLGRAVTAVTGRERFLRLERLESLTDALQAALSDRRPHRATLGGTRIALGPDAWLVVSLEAPRRRGCRMDAPAIPPQLPSLRPN